MLMEYKISIIIAKIIHHILGYFVIFLAFFFKVPQIMKIYERKTSKGINVLSKYFDFYSILFQGLYSLHKKLSFLVYFENFTATLFNITIIIQSWYYSDKKPTATDLIWRIVFCHTSILFTVYIILDGYLPDFAWTTIIYLGMPLMAFSRCGQMWEIGISMDVGSVSFLSFLLRSMKNYIKIVVIMFETFNRPLILNQLFNGVLSTGVMIMYIMYDKTPKKPIPEKKNFLEVTKKEM